MMAPLHKKIAVGALLLLICALLGYAGLYIKKQYRTELLTSPIVHRMIPLYRSLRKLPDIVFMPWAAFSTSNLETFEITISPQNIEQMNAVLPENPFNSAMDEDSKLWVPAYFRVGDYEDSVKIRYRGNLAAHWNAYQKSYAIKFPKDNLFHGMREMNLVIPSKRRYLAMSLNDYRAEKLGLIHPDETLITLEVNGASMGVMLAFEGWSQEWIEKMPISALSTIYGVDEGTTPYRDRWDSWNAEDPVDFEPLEALDEIVEHTSDEKFKKLIPLLVDIEDWYAWDVMRILAGGYHVSPNTSFGENNLVIIFDRAEGRFKPVPYNTVIYTPSFREMVGTEGVVSRPTKLYQRILSFPEFRNRRDEVFKEYVHKEKENDLAFLENWKQTYNREFLLGSAKNDNNFMYLSKIEENTQSAIEHFDDPFDILSATYTPAFTQGRLSLPASFQHLEAASVDAKTAAKQHPSLRLTESGLTIPPGTHIFTKTIIIPAGTHLTILPGAHLKMSEDTSLISYSPVTAVGTSNRPITIAPQQKDKTWGVFAVVNTDSSTSTFQHMTLTRGSEATVNGAYISGTLALHNARSIIDDVTVSQAQGDDGINIKGSYVTLINTTLTENSSDGIDLDYIDPDSVITNNTFLNNHGDALDISWSNIAIEKNIIDTCTDKGISVGEKSKPTITGNIITNCNIAIAVKDSSEAIITDNTITDNVTAFSLYQKKPFFSGGRAIATDNTLMGNSEAVFTDSLSSIMIE